MLDFDTDDDDEPRTMVIRGFGPRWAEPPAALGAGRIPVKRPGPEVNRTPEARRPHPATTPQTPERNS